MAEDLLANLDAAQQEVARSCSGAVAVTAVAGAGKTRAIAHRIAYAVATGVHTAETGLAITYTTKAAAELRRRLSALGVNGLTVGTIHAVALRQLNYFWPKVFAGSAWPVTSGRDARLLDLVTEHLAKLNTSQAKSLVAEIEWAKASGLDPELYAQLPPRTLDGYSQIEVIDIWQRYSEQMVTAQQLDFDDVLQLLIGILDSNPEILAEVRRRYTWITVDEFQDVTPLQFSLIKLWLGERDELCVVGDPQQSIYEFAGANPNLMSDVVKAFPTAKQIELQHTYRLPVSVADLAGKLSGAEITAMGQDPGEVFENQYLDSAEESGAVAAQIQLLLDAGADPREIAILVRIGGQVEKYERALNALGVPTTSRNAIRFEDPLIRRTLLILRAWTGGQAGADLVSTVSAAAIEAGWSENLPDSASWEAGSALVAVARDLVLVMPGAKAEDFVSEVETRIAALDPPKPMAIALLTMHSAKGLEWQHVFLPELNSSLLPYPLAPLRAERNLLYVAVTRTKHGLYLSYSDKDERGRATSRSTLLNRQPKFADHKPKVMQAALPEPTPFASKIENSNCRICGRGLSSAAEFIVQRCRVCPANFNPAALSALQSWRKQKAFELGELEWQLLTDGSLQALAEIRPTSLAELSQIHGLLPTKVEQFGDEIIELLGSF